MLNVVCAAAFAARVLQRGDVRYPLEKPDLHETGLPLLPFQIGWRARLRKLPNTEAEIVFAGDSLIAKGPWAELYSSIKNCGIDGETTAGLFDRLHLNLDGYLGLGRLLESHVVDRIRQER
jgi:hypothetical protein